jgi:uncharacterized repeat protein (TIGR03803 family)
MREQSSIVGSYLRRAAVSALTILFSSLPSLAAKPVFTSLYSFGGPGDAANPVSPAVVGSSGVLYGTTKYGGAYGYGAVLSFSPPAVTGGSWSETVIWSFGGWNGDGYYPVAALVIGSNGVLYGTTMAGGPFGYGTAFSLTPPVSAGGIWTEGIMADFDIGPEGAVPTGPLSLGSSGVLFGTTTSGGSQNWGTVFSLSPTGQTSLWFKTVVYIFTGDGNGGQPSGRLLIGSGGEIYGTLGAGSGTAGGGAVFSLERV